MKASKSRFLKKPDKFKSEKEKLEEMHANLTFVQKMQGFFNGLVFDKRLTEGWK